VVVEGENSTFVPANQTIEVESQDYTSILNGNATEFVQKN
jgi:hypothetical protein